jgi:hypothetical protein
MAYLAIRKLKYSGDLYEYESPTFDDGLNIIEGSNGTGKTTFAELLYFCLSGTSEMLNPEKPHKHNEILNDKNNYVELLIEIDKKHYLISRYIRSNDITVKFNDGDLQVFPIFRSKENKTIFSDWILNKIGIEPVELTMGVSRWQLNIKDLFRLLYHDQAPNPMDVYKASDTSGFITDSKVMRKAIFEVLLGKSFHEYYRIYGDLRLAENEKSKAKGAIELYRQMISEVDNNREDLNLSFLKNELEVRRNQLQKLETYLDSINITPVMPKDVFTKVEHLKVQLIELQIKESELRRKEAELLDEIIKLRKVRSNLIIETTQIKKMVYTHDKLTLFSSDTCPYCLRDVERIKGKCVCGADIDELQYERFFYSSEEYIEILKTKQKSVDTVDIAIKATQDELKDIRDNISTSLTKSKDISKKFETRIAEGDKLIDTQRIREIGDKIMNIRKEISSFEQQIILETKRQALEDKINSSETQYSTLSKKVAKLYADANLEMDERIRDFNKIYNDLMKECVTDCRRAYLDTDYMPVINDGEYREASAAVPRRLFYFFTLLYLSIKNSSISYPRFLLIDTPETSGIDTDNLIKSLSCFTKIIPKEPPYDCQVILLTGNKKFPKAYSGKLKQTLKKEARLLKKK